MYRDKFIFGLYSRPFFLVAMAWEIILTAYLHLFFTYISKCMSLCSGFLSLYKLAFAKKKSDNYIYILKKITELTLVNSENLKLHSLPISFRLYFIIFLSYFSDLISRLYRVYKLHDNVISSAKAGSSQQ